MKTYFLDEHGAMSLKDIPAPEPTEHNAIVKVDATSICGTDFRAFMYGNTKIKPPLVLGHENAGTVVHAGVFAKAHGLEVGARVTVVPAIGCGDCWPCSVGRTNMCDLLITLGFQHCGAFAEYMEIPQQAIKMGNVLSIPQGVSLENAVLAEPAACALNAQSYLNISKGDFVVIYGGGFVGCLHAEFAFASGADRVVIVEVSEERRIIAKQMVTYAHVIDPATDTPTQVSKLTGGRGANVVITAVSVAATHVESLRIASKMGRISLFGGIPGDGKGYLDSNLIHYNELSVYGAHATTASMMKDVLNRVDAGTLNLKKYITRKFPLLDIEKGFMALRDENAMKVVLYP